MEKKLNLKAVILVGGFGTRLRPLTFTKPKPLIELCNKATLSYQIEALKSIGVNEIVLAINYQPDTMKKYLLEEENKHGIKIVCSKEDKPLGTAGPIGLARDLYFDEPFDHLFVFNADIITEYNLQKLLDYHIEKKGEGTICVTKVEEPSRYGVIISDSEGKINSFVEKPEKFISDEINAGLYCFKYEFLKRIETKPSSIEREIFPKMASDGVLYSMNLNSFWMDIGQPKDFLKGNMMLLNHNKINVLKANGVLIEDGANVGPYVVLGENVVVKKNASIKNSVIMSDCIIDENASIENSIIGWNCKIGKSSTITSMSVLGEDVQISEKISIENGIILPNVVVKKNIKDEIIMS